MNEIAYRLGYEDGKAGRSKIGVSVSYINGYREGEEERYEITSAIHMYARHETPIGRVGEWGA